MTACIFCQIIARQAPAEIVAEDDDVIVFLSLEHHPLVVPKAHVPDLFGLSDALGAAVVRQTIRIGRAVKLGWHCDGISLGQANGAAAGQEVFHFHLHVYPRWHPGSAQRIDLTAGLDRPTRQALATAIRQALGNE